MTLRISLSTVAVLALGCSGTPGARPADMSASEHEAAASAHQREGDAHAESYSDAKSTTIQHCGAATSGRGDGFDGACWTSSANPTDAHRMAAEVHRKMAADHRAASAELLSSEGRSCTGVADHDRDESPFSHREDITNVERISASPEGVAITMRAVPGLSRAYLQHIVECHLARNAAMGFVMSEMAFCPLGVKGATANVEETSSGFRVTIVAPNREASDQIWRRASTLQTHS